jgi:hypothetical protein
MSVGPGPLLGGGDWYQPRGRFGPWGGCGCSSLLIIVAGILLVCAGFFRIFNQ